MPGTTEQMIRDHFQKFGEIKYITLNKAKQECRDIEDGGPQVMERNTNLGKSPNNHRGCGFVEFLHSHSIKAATHVKEHYMNGHKIDCRIAMTNNERKNYQKSIMRERRKVFIGKLPAGVTREMLHNYFVQFSEIEEITLIFKPDKSFGISFILFKKPYIGDYLVNKIFTIQPGIAVECELALNPQQLHERKLQESHQTSVLAELDEKPAFDVKVLDSNKATLSDSNHRRALLLGGCHDHPNENYSSWSKDWMARDQTRLNPLRMFDPQLTQADENEHVFSKTFPMELTLQKRESQSERHLSVRKIDTDLDFVSPQVSQHDHQGYHEAASRRQRLLSDHSMDNKFDCAGSQDFLPINQPVNQIVKQDTMLKKFTELIHKRRQSCDGIHLYRLFN